MISIEPTHRRCPTAREPQSRRTGQDLGRRTVWMQILTQGRDLGIVRGLLDNGVMKMNAFK
jgi:hypothetical protein